MGKNFKEERKHFLLKTENEKLKKFKNQTLIAFVINSIINVIQVKVAVNQLEDLENKLRNEKIKNQKLKRELYQLDKENRSIINSNMELELEKDLLLIDRGVKIKDLETIISRLEKKLSTEK